MDKEPSSSAPIVLLSGGLDSAVCLALALKRSPRPRCLFVDYGQPARIVENQAAKKVADHYGVELANAWVGGVELLGMGDTTGTPGPRVVPARNALLIVLAANRSQGPVWIGATLDDQADYPDCRRTFFDAMSAAAEVEIATPLIRLSKSEVVAKARELEVPLELTWSCYAPTRGAPCGMCNGCLARKEAGAWEPSTSLAVMRQRGSGCR